MPDEVSSVAAALWARRDRKALILHAEQSWHDSILAGKFDFFTKLEARAKDEGYTVLAARLESGASRYLRHGRGIQIIVSERPKPGARRMHAMPTHIWGFWHFDPKGILQFSSIFDRSFEPAQVDATAARYFYEGVRGHMLRANVSRHAQGPRGAVALRPARAVVFTQHIDRFRKMRPYIETVPMLEATLRALAPDLVYVKLHPDQRPETLAQIREVLARHPHAVEIVANVHDLIATADLVVTQNSTAGFEALMQEKPVVTCAPCAFHHATVVARTPEALEAAVKDAKARMAGFDYAAYFYWFLAENCLEPAKPGFADRAWRLLQQHCAA